jgi:hypothetical protein
VLALSYGHCPRDLGQHSRKCGSGAFRQRFLDHLLAAKPTQGFLGGRSEQYRCNARDLDSGPTLAGQNPRWSEYRKMKELWCVVDEHVDDFDNITTG